MRRAGVVFDTYEEACLFVAAYAGINSGTSLHRQITKLIAGYAELEDDDDALTEGLSEAIRLIAQYNGFEIKAA